MTHLIYYLDTFEIEMHEKVIIITNYDRVGLFEL